MPIVLLVLPGVINVRAFGESVPVYDVAVGGVAGYDQGTNLAATLGVTDLASVSVEDGRVSYLRPDLFLNIPTLPMANPGLPDAPDEIYLPVFEAIDFGALTNIQRLASSNAIARLGTALDASLLTPLPPMTYTTSVSSAAFEFWYSPEDGVTNQGQALIDKQVHYEFFLGGIPLIGRGAQIDVAYHGPTGDVSHLLYALRQVAAGPGAMVELIGQDAASNRCADIYLQSFGGNAVLSLTNTLVYYAPDLTLTNVSAILPYYLCSGTAVTEGNVTNNLPLQLIPATDDPLFVPSLTNFSVSVDDVSREITADATGAVSGGTPPYTYEWTSALSDLARVAHDPTSPTLHYTVTNRIRSLRDVTLSISSFDAGELALSWPEPYFALETNSVLNDPGRWNDLTGTLGTTHYETDVSGWSSMFYRLLFVQTNAPMTEVLTLVVTDANGAQASINHTLSVPVWISAESWAGNTNSVGVTYAIESPYEPDEGVNERSSFQEAMGARPELSGEEVFCSVGADAWERDFKEWPRWETGRDADYVDNVDLLFFVGHGSGLGFEFTDTNHDDNRLTYEDVWPVPLLNGAWGDKELEWLALHSCNVLDDEYNGLAWWQRWGPSFDGLHQILGFRSVALNNLPTQKEFVERMLGSEDEEAMTICRAWILANRLYHQGKQVVFPVVMGVLGPGGVSNINDYYWTVGDVGPDIPPPFITGFWRVTDVEED